MKIDHLRDTAHLPLGEPSAVELPLGEPLSQIATATDKTHGAKFQKSSILENESAHF